MSTVTYAVTDAVATITLDDGGKLELRHFLCFAEKVHNKW